MRCMPPTNAYVLARCDRDGKNIYLVSRNNEPDYLPSVLDDGRVIYTRWEYTDKPLWRAQGLWTINPDGTQVKRSGATRAFGPTLLKDARGIPGSRSRHVHRQRATTTGSPGASASSIPARTSIPQRTDESHRRRRLARGRQRSGRPVESPHYQSPGRYGAYQSPYPLSEDLFLVSAKAQWGREVLPLSRWTSTETGS